jgi:hypothetical protein
MSGAAALVCTSKTTKQAANRGPNLNFRITYYDN